MKDPHLYIYKASAGSGKTYTLAVEYIKLLIHNPFNYRHILAVTFTNKATCEMKERILSQLYGIAYQLPSSESYLKKIKEDMRVADEDIRMNAGKALNLLTHDYDNFHVETIDSFFQLILRNMARELGLGANLNIDLDSEGALDEAVDSMIKKLTHDSQVLQWIFDYVQERMEEGENWKVINRIKRFGGKVFDEEYIERGASLRKKMQENPSLISEYSKELKLLIQEQKELMAGFADQFFGILETNKIPTQTGYCNKSIVSYFNKIKGDGFYSVPEEKVRNKTVLSCLEKPDAWTIKTSPMRNQIIVLAEKELMPLLKETEDYRSKCTKMINTCMLALKNLNDLRLLTFIDQELHTLNEQKNRFLLANTNALLQGMISNSDSSFLFEKIGATINYVMIDEFQDTSRMQFGNFRILLNEGLSQGYDSLIVGDVKQSIYRWRNGDWGILNALNENSKDFPVQVKTLDTNYRSEKNIISFNNSLFLAIVHLMNLQNQTIYGEECEALKLAYKDVEQKCSHKEDIGYVSVKILATDSENRKEDDVMLPELAGTVKYLIENKSVKMSDIAILLRTKKDIKTIADYFQENMPAFPLVSDEAFLLSSSQMVGLLIDAIRVLEDETDTVALSSLITVYQNEVLKKGTDLNTLLLESDKKQFLPEAFTEKQEELKMMPLYELCERLYSLFELNCLHGEDAYLFAFFDVMTEYLNEHSSDLSSFLQEWDDRLSGKTIPSGDLDGIRLITIHKSKGLQFHTVIVPYCNWAMNNMRSSVWCHPTVSPFNQLDLLSIDFSSKMHASYFDKEYIKEQLQQWVDNLNLLYVALTRPEKNLFIIGTYKVTKNGYSNAGTVSNLLHDSIAELVEGEEVDTYETGTICRSEEKTKKESDNVMEVTPKPIAVKMCSYDRTVEFRQSNQSADFIRSQEEEEANGKYIQQGKLLHRIFSEIRRVEDVKPLLVRLKMDGFFSSALSFDEIARLVERALEQPLAKDWFGGEWNLFNERDILIRTEDGFVKRRPDRVMIKDGRVVVVDFKFGRPRPVYEDQVRVYMKLLSQMGYKNVRGYLWYVYVNQFVSINK